VKARQNVIVSHGGRHGAQARTYLKDTEVGRDVSKHIPNRYISAPTEEPPGSRADAPKPVGRGEEGQSTDDRPDATRKPAAAPTPPPAPPAPSTEVVDRKGGEDIPPPAEPPAADEDAPVDGEVDLPTSKRQLFAMRKAELMKLAEALGAESEGTVEELRARLSEEIGL